MAWTKEQQKVYCRKWHQVDLARFPEKYREHKLKRFYGLTLEQYKQLVINQGGRCKICSKKQPLCVDHDHKSKKVRGLLCRRCNSGIGLLGDSIDSINSALEYLIEAQ